MRGAEGRGEGHVAVVGQLRADGKRIPTPYAEAVARAGGRPKVFSTFGLVPGEPIPDPLDLQSVAREQLSETGGRRKRRSLRR